MYRLIIGSRSTGVALKRGEPRKELDYLSYAHVLVVCRSPSVCVDRERRATMGLLDPGVLQGLQVNRVDQGRQVHLPQVLPQIVVCSVS